MREECKSQKARAEAKIQVARQTMERTIAEMTPEKAKEIATMRLAETNEPLRQAKESRITSKYALQKRAEEDKYSRIRMVFKPSVDVDCEELGSRQAAEQQRAEAEAEVPKKVC